MRALAATFIILAAGAMAGVLLLLWKGTVEQLALELK